MASGRAQRRLKGATLALAALQMAMPHPVLAREALGVFEGWGAFRDDRPARCYAIAKAEPRGGKAVSRPFASVATWSGTGVRGQIHVRLRRPAGQDARVGLTIDDKRFRLMAKGSDAWAPTPGADLAIVAAMRTGRAMRIDARGENDRAFSDTYRLRGAATAIDAATLACARRG